MLRDVRLEDISDGRFYTAGDMVKADCQGCQGCHACCTGMGQSIVLDPMDVHRLTEGLGIKFEALLASALELNVVDGIILPNIRMKEDCAFLDENGRCKVHSIRPGICRLFPLGRYYEEDGSFRYFLQIHECKNQNRTKVKVKKWLEIPQLSEYEAYIRLWHSFQKHMQQYVAEHADAANAVSMYILQEFYLKPYGAGTFYKEFKMRLDEAKKLWS